MHNNSLIKIKRQKHKSSALLFLVISHFGAVPAFLAILASKRFYFNSWALNLSISFLALRISFCFNAASYLNLARSCCWRSFASLASFFLNLASSAFSYLAVLGLDDSYELVSEALADLSAGVEARLLSGSRSRSLLGSGSGVLFLTGSGSWWWCCCSS